MSYDVKDATNATITFSSTDVSSVKHPRQLVEFDVGGTPTVVSSSNPFPVNIASSITLTANLGTLNGVALDATLTGGTQKSIMRGGAKGSTTAADVTSTASGANHQLIDVAIYDASGNQITSFGGGSGGTQYADGASAATPTGTQANWNESGTQRSVSMAKPLPVQPGTSVTFPVSAATLPLPTGAATAAKQPALGTAGTASSDVITVQGIASMTPVNVNMTQLGGVTAATGNGVVGTGVQRVAIASDNSNIPTNIAQMNGVTILMGAGNTGTGSQRVTIATDQAKLPVHGDVAAGSSDAGSPVKTGGVARTTNPTAVSDGQRVNAQFDKVGRQVIVSNSCRELTGDQSTTITSSTAETAIVTAGGAGIFLDLTSLTITNSNATTDTTVTLRPSTGGTAKGPFQVPARGGIVLTFTTPLAQTTANNNWTLQCGTSVASILVLATFVRNV